MQGVFAPYKKIYAQNQHLTKQTSIIQFLRPTSASTSPIPEPSTSTADPLPPHPEPWTSSPVSDDAVSGPTTLMSPVFVSTAYSLLPQESPLDVILLNSL